MTIASGSNGIGKIMLGSSTEVIRVYLGTTIVYENQKPNIFKFKVNANQTLTLQNDTRGATAITTDWGDGTKNTSLTHTYTTAGVYTVTTTYSIATTTATVKYPTMGWGEYYGPVFDETTALALREVVQICNKITNLNYMFWRCQNLAWNRINTDNIDTSKFDSAVEMFHYVAYNMSNDNDPFI